MCFVALKTGFRYGYKLVIGVDGFHMNHKHGGVFLTVVRINP